MSGKARESLGILLKNVPGDIVAELERRAEANFRSRSGEVLAILAAACRGDATLPGLGVGETLPTIRGTEAANQDGPANQDGEAQEAGGDV